MARESSGGPDVPPADFVSFVARRTPGLRRAAHALSGNDRLAESLVDDLLTAVAVRWRWLAFTERQGRRGAADVYLDRILDREARAFNSRDRYRPVAAAPLAPAAAAGLAARHWTRGARTRRRRRYVAATVAAALVVGLSAAPRGGGQPDGEAQSAPTTAVALPPLVDVLPTFDEQGRLARLSTALPAEIGLDPARTAGWLLPGQLVRAIAVFLMTDTPPMVLGEDGQLRLLDVDLPTRRGQPPITTASLAPDGRRVAFLGTDELVVVELKTAKASRFPEIDASVAVVWLTGSTLLAAGTGGAVVLDLGGGSVNPTTIDARNVLTPHGGLQPTAPPPTVGPPSPGSEPSPGSGPSATAGTGLPAALTERVIELLPIGEPATAPARVRRYAQVAADVAIPMETVLNGDGIGWLGPWRGPGFLVGGVTGRAARDCDPGALVLPGRYGDARLAAVAVQPITGRVERTLVGPVAATSLRSGMVLGWLDLHTALVRTSDGRGQNLLAWRVTDGDLRLVSTVNRDSATTVADIAAVRPR